MAARMASAGLPDCFLSDLLRTSEELPGWFRRLLRASGRMAVVAAARWAGMRLALVDGWVSAKGRMAPSPPGPLSRLRGRGGSWCVFGGVAGSTAYPPLRSGHGYAVGPQSLTPGPSPWRCPELTDTLLRPPGQPWVVRVRQFRTRRVGGSRVRNGAAGDCRRLRCTRRRHDGRLPGWARAGGRPAPS